jgi:hypothetical protein
MRKIIFWNKQRQRLLPVRKNRKGQMALSFLFFSFLNKIACAIINTANSPKAYNLKVSDKTPNSLNQKDLT